MNVSRSGTELQQPRPPRRRRRSSTTKRTFPSRTTPTLSQQTSHSTNPIMASRSSTSTGRVSQQASLPSSRSSFASSSYPGVATSVVVGSGNSGRVTPNYSAPSFMEPQRPPAPCHTHSQGRTRDLLRPFSPPFSVYPHSLPLQNESSSSLLSFLPSLPLPVPSRSSATPRPPLLVASPGVLPRTTVAPSPATASPSCSPSTAGTRSTSFPPLPRPLNVHRRPGAPAFTPSAVSRRGQGPAHSVRSYNIAGAFSSAPAGSVYALQCHF